MKKPSGQNVLLILSCTIILSFAAINCIRLSFNLKRWQEMHAHAGNELEYKLSKVNTHYDSLYVIRTHNLTIDEQINTSEWHLAWMDSIQCIYRDIFLSYAQTPADSLTVIDTMMSPIDKVDRKAWKQEIRQRKNNIIKKLNINESDRN